MTLLVIHIFIHCFQLKVFLVKVPEVYVDLEQDSDQIESYCFGIAT